MRVIGKSGLSLTAFAAIVWHLPKPVDTFHNSVSRWGSLLRDAFHELPNPHWDVGSVDGMTALSTDSRRFHDH